MPWETRVLAGASLEAEGWTERILALDRAHMRSVLDAAGLAFPEENRRRGLRDPATVLIALVEGDDLLGHDVNLTARLLDHCTPGEVLVSLPAKELAEKRLKKISFGKERMVKIRGLAGRKSVFAANPGS